MIKYLPYRTLCCVVFVLLLDAATDKKELSLKSKLLLKLQKSK